MTITWTDLVVHDEIYGTVTLHGQRDAVLIALIHSPAFQRLKRVLQHGISALPTSNICGGASVTRFDHSIGACLLVRRLGASLEEQVAAVSLEGSLCKAGRAQLTCMYSHSCCTILRTRP